MMGRSHFASGVTSGLAVCAVVDVPPSLVPVVVGVSAYSALAPDLDHWSAPAARVLGPVSWLLCLSVRWLSARTTGVRHRGITHSIVFALAWGVLVTATALSVLPVQAALWTGGAAVLGCVTHILGDVATVSGCRYVLWPSTVQVSIPYLLRFRTGGVAERWAAGALVVGAVALLPAVLS